MRETGKVPDVPFRLGGLADLLFGRAFPRLGFDCDGFRRGIGVGVVPNEFLLDDVARDALGVGDVSGVGEFLQPGQRMAAAGR